MRKWCVVFVLAGVVLGTSCGSDDSQAGDEVTIAPQCSEVVDGLVAQSATWPDPATRDELQRIDSDSRRTVTENPFCDPASNDRRQQLICGYFDSVSPADDAATVYLESIRCTPGRFDATTTITVATS